MQIKWTVKLKYYRERKKDFQQPPAIIYYYS